jgi:hypothetical protein
MGKELHLETLFLVRIYSFRKRVEKQFSTMHSQKLQTTCALDSLLPRPIFYPCLAEIVLVCSMVWSERNEENTERLGRGRREATDDFL